MELSKMTKAVIVNFVFIVCTCFIFIANKTPTMHKPFISIKTTLNGKIIDVLTGGVVVGATVTGPEGSCITDSKGNYSIEYDEERIPQITIEHSDYITRTTFSTWITEANLDARMQSLDNGSDFTVIPNSFDMETFHDVMRGNFQARIIRIWAKQPDYKIILTDMDDRIKGYIFDILSTNEIELLTGGKIKGTTTPEEGTDIPSDRSYYVVFGFKDLSNDVNAVSIVDCDPYKNYEIIRACIWLNKNRNERIQRRTVLHEIGHAMGHHSHSNRHKMLMAIRNLEANYITQWDIDNGTVAYSRPSGNAEPDHDPFPSGLTAFNPYLSRFLKKNYRLFFFSP